MIQIPDKVKAFFLHSKTVFVARLYTFAGAIGAAGAYILPWLSGQDLTPIVARLFHDIPEDLRPLFIAVVVGATGELFVALRKVTDQSIAEKAENAETPS